MPLLTRSHFATFLCCILVKKQQPSIVIISIMNIHINLTKRITSFSEIIANEVSYEEVLEDISSNIITN